MRIGRIRNSEGARFACLQENLAQPLDDAPWTGALPAGPARAWTEKDLVCPVTPSKIICIGRNYAAHAKELKNPLPKEPLLFLKPPSSLIGMFDTILLPIESERVEHEAELGVVIGRRGRNIPVEDAASYIFGYTCVLDITARDLQKKDGQWTRAKGFDTFCPVGPWIETELDSSKQSIVLSVNGAERQRGSTSDMIFDVPTIVSYVSRVMTLEPGDLLSTGTPEGVGELAAGDKLEMEISNIGRLVVSIGKSAP